MTSESTTTHSMRRYVLAGLVAVTTFAAGVLARGQGAAMGDAVLQPLTHDVAKELAMKITEPFTFAAVGDIIIRKPVGTGDAGYQALTKVMRDADITYANMEGPILDEATFRGPLAGGPKSVVDELKTMGVRIMTTANNHTMDAGDAGMYETNRLLDEAGIVHAGSGRNLADAREARIAATRKGTVAVIGMYSIDPSNSPEPSRYFDATNTKAGLALARKLLVHRKNPNKQIFLITDGKPSAIWERGQLYKNPFGLDLKIVNRTLEEADAWFEYLESTRGQSETRYAEVEPWAWARLSQRLRAVRARRARLRPAAA